MLTILNSLYEIKEGEPLPTEFRIFAAGWNDTSKGRSLFDAEAAASVMGAYQKHGVDVMIDLNHDSLDQKACAARSDAQDARGWMQLELRADGSLWAVNVRWTPDGEKRLREKTQRYISPAFAESKHLDLPDDSRPRELVNVAICAMPATHNAPALVAASKRAIVGAHAPSAGAPTAPCYATTVAAKTTALTNSRNMDPKLMAAALDAIEKGDATAILEVLKALVAAAAGGGAAPPEPAEPTSESADPPPPPAGGAAPDAEEQKALAVLAQRVLALTKSTTAGAALREIETLSTQISQRATDAAATELSERRGLIADLVKLRAETPATAWEGDTALTIPCKRLSAEPITDMRARVAALKAANPAPPAPLVPPVVAGDVTKLTKEEIAAAKKRGLTPEEFAERKANAIRRPQEHK